MSAHDPGKAEDKCPRPENGAGTGNQDECPSGFSYHIDIFIARSLFLTLKERKKLNQVLPHWF